MNKEMYQSKSHQELKKILQEAQYQLGVARFSSKDSSSQVKPSEISRLKKEVARIKTALVLNNKQ